MGTTRELEAREKQIKVAVNRKLGDHEINHMLKEKEKFMLNPRNYAMYKSKLKKDLDTAIATGQEEAVEKLTQKLNSLEERAEELDRQRSSKISSIALINDKNRKKNIERAEEGIRLEMERIKKEGVVSKVFTLFIFTAYSLSLLKVPSCVLLHKEFNEYLLNM